MRIILTTIAVCIMSTSAIAQVTPLSNSQLVEKCSSIMQGDVLLGEACIDMDKRYASKAETSGTEAERARTLKND